MWTGIGIACVLWTLYEGISLAVKAVRESRSRCLVNAARKGAERSGATRRRRKTFAAWDDHGRPIRVEDLGVS